MFDTLASLLNAVESDIRLVKNEIAKLANTTIDATEAIKAETAVASADSSTATKATTTIDETTDAVTEGRVASAPAIEDTTATTTADDGTTVPVATADNVVINPVSSPTDDESASPDPVEPVTTPLDPTVPETDTQES